MQVSRKTVTIATNMVRRGTDIKLGDGVVELEDCTFLNERHESRRIDNQLADQVDRATQESQDSSLSTGR